MTATNIEDLRRQAKRWLPKIFFDYIDGGAFGEETLRANSVDFSRYALRQRVLRAAISQDLTTRVIDWDSTLPFILGPVGYLGLYRGNGELSAARAAKKARIPFCLSSFSIASLADVAKSTDGPLGFQLYMLDDKDLCEHLIAEAEGLGVTTIFLTVDTPVTAIRERDVKNGFRSVTRVTPRLAAGLLPKPAWLLDILRNGFPSARGFDHLPDYGRGALEQAANLSRRIDRTLDWKAVERLRERWKGKLVVKGLLDPEDALIAKGMGADGIVVSNHGGRQLDGALSTIRALPAVRAAVGSDFPVLLDGGIRRGTDIIKAIALGADAVCLGRAYAFGLAAAGQRGVETAIAILQSEIEVSLALMGLSSISDLKREGLNAVVTL